MFNDCHTSFRCVFLNKQSWSSLFKLGDKVLQEQICPGIQEQVLHLHRRGCSCIIQRQEQGLQVDPLRTGTILISGMLLAQSASLACWRVGRLPLEEQASREASMETFTVLRKLRKQQRAGKEGLLHLTSAKILKKLFQSPVSFEQRAPARSAGTGAPFTASVGCCCWLLELGPQIKTKIEKIGKVKPRTQTAASLYSNSNT